MSRDEHRGTTSPYVTDANIALGQQIHSGARHRLYRVDGTDGKVVVKVPTAASVGTIVAMRHEYEILRDLELPSVVRVVGLANIQDELALIMQDAGESNLAEVICSDGLSISDFLDIAIELTAAVARLHDARIVHRDINPSNVVWEPKSRKATLCDFAIATTLSALTIENAGAHELEGTIAYMAPEQTGRTGRSVDSRTDLYSLGASFYEMLSGAPPFAGRDPIELVHAHIARQPAPLHELKTDVPVAISAIVSKLLEKEPGRRYQTADALLIDLREARAQWSRDRAIAPFPLATRDVSRELHVPDALYGRDQELQALEAACDRAARGGRELLLITGAPGIGKSALVNHLGRSVAKHRGIYIAGKFDQLQRSVPFSGLARAFQSLVRQLLLEPEATLSEWRERLEAAISPNGRLIVEVVPDLERIIGPQPAVPDVGPVESKNRFNSTFTKFLAAIARRERPLTLFLDDLQWVDAASLQLIEQWLGDAACRYLLMVGAYRDIEVGSAHPLAMSLAACRGAGISIDELQLGPIGRDDIAQLLADTFKSSDSDTEFLAHLVLRKTAGNPFFVRQLIHLLHAEGFIRFQPHSGTWQWDVAQLERAPVTDNVLDLMATAIARLSPSTRTLLEIGACIGHRFELKTLAEVAGLARADATNQLWPALEDGLLVPIREAYKASRRTGPLEASLENMPAVLEFAHDRVQQTAYSMLHEDRRRALHLDIGRRLLASATEAQVEERLFDIVDQLDLGEQLIDDEAERVRLVELNISAGRKANASAAYQAACEYLNVALRLLNDASWGQQFELTFTVHRELAEAAYLTGQHARAEQLIETALAHASSKVARADLYSLRVLAATVAGDWQGALRSGRDGLAVFGQEWPLDALTTANDAEVAAVMNGIGSRRIGDLVNDLEVNDAEIRACMRLLSLLSPPAYFSGDEALTFLLARAVNLSLLHGPSPYSAFAYALFAAVHNARSADYATGYALGQLALGLARRFANRAEESRVLEVFGLVVHVWKAPVRESLPLLREGARAGVESGELAYAAFNLNSVLINGLHVGVPVADLRSEADVAIEFATKHHNRTSIEIALPFRQFARAMLGLTRSPTSFDDDEFEEAIFLREAESNHTALGNFWVAKLRAAYLLGDYDAARYASREGAKHTAAGILGMVPSADHVFYSALTLIETSAQPHAGLLELERTLVNWATHCPQNFAHKAALVGAGIAKLGGNYAEAMKLYRAAIDGAAQERFIQDEALAHELRARLLEREQENAFASVHYRAARDRYKRWGGVAKVSALEDNHSDRFTPESRASDHRAPMDTLALIKASQAISAETEAERLFGRIVRAVVEVAGAQFGALILVENSDLFVCARNGASPEVSVSQPPMPLDQCPDLPASVLRYVLRMREPLLLTDAAAAEAFAVDPVVRRRKLRSILAVPLVQQLKVVGLVYLENEAMAGAFTAEIIEVVQVLAAQAVISLENVRLHQRSQQEIEQRREVERALNEADRRKDEFLAMLAHELRNPLAPIGSASEALARMLPNDRKVQSAVGIIGRQVTHMSRLVDDLLDVSRITQGRIELAREPIDLSEVVRHAVETAEPLMRAKQHRIMVKHQRRTHLCEWRLRQACTVRGEHFDQRGEVHGASRRNPHRNSRGRPACNR